MSGSGARNQEESEFRFTRVHGSLAGTLERDASPNGNEVKYATDCIQEVPETARSMDFNQATDRPMVAFPVLDELSQTRQPVDPNAPPSPLNAGSGKEELKF